MSNTKLVRVFSTRRKIPQCHPGKRIGPFVESKFFTSEDPLAQTQYERIRRYRWRDGQLLDLDGNRSEDPELLWNFFKGPIPKNAKVTCEGPFAPENLNLQKIHSRNLLGVPGVSQRGNRFIAKKGGKYLGMFETVEEARRAVESVQKPSTVPYRK